MKAEGAETALFYFAGHALEFEGENYLIPTDATVRSSNRVAFETVTLKNVLASMRYAKGLRMIILDACRNDPFPAMTRKNGQRSSSRGLAVPKEEEAGLLISFSAAAGTVADDGAGNHSPNTTALLRHMETPGLELNMLLRRVRADVKKETNGGQTPFDYGSLPDKEIYLSPEAKVDPEADTAKLSPAVRDDACADAATHWLSVKDSKSPKLLEQHVAQFSACSFAPLARDAIQQIEADWKLRVEKRRVADLEVSANAGDVQSIKTLATQYLFGPESDANYFEAMKWFQKAADRNDADSIARLAWMATAGPADEQNRTRSMTLARKSIELGSSLGMLLMAQQTVGEESQQWYLKAANSGNAEAMRALGEAYQWGDGQETDIGEAVVWYRKAATLGDKMSMMTLGKIYIDAISPAGKNENLAAEWYGKAGKLGNPAAIVALADFRPRDAALIAFDELQSGNRALRRALKSDFQWIPEFRKILQCLLFLQGAYNGPIDGDLEGKAKALIDSFYSSEEEKPFYRVCQAINSLDPVDCIVKNYTSFGWEIDAASD